MACVRCAAAALLLLLLLAVCRCVVADTRRGENNWATVVQWAGERSGYKKCERGASYFKRKNMGFVHAPTRIREAERNSFKKRASSATLNAQSTAMEFVGDPDMHRKVPTVPLLNPQPKV